MSQVSRKFIQDAAINAAKLASDSVITIKILDANVTGAKLENNIALPGAPTTTTAAPGDSSTKIATTAFVGNAVSTALAGLDFQADVLDKQVDATLDPGAAPTLGDRYIITDSGSLHANFGTIAGIGNNDIVQYDGADFVVVYDVSVQGEGAIAWNRDDNTFEYYDGSSWAAFGGLAGVTAGAGLTKTGNTLDVGAGDGIDVAADSISVDVSDIAGAGLENDGSNNLRIASTAAGAGLALSAGVLSVNVDDSTIEINTDTLRVKDAGITAAKLAAAVAGDGLTGGAGSALAVGAGDGISVAADAVAVSVAALAGSGLEDDGSNNLRIAASAAGAGLTGGAGSALAVGAGDGITVNADDIDVKVNAATLKINGSNEVEGLKPAKESFTLAGGDITNQYIDLAQVAKASSIRLFVVGGPEQEEGVDYTVSLTGGAGGNTRLSFAGGLATGGASELVATDVVKVAYEYL